MISFSGYDEIIRRVYDNNQEQVFNFWANLNENEKITLLEDLAEIDFSLINRLYTENEISSRHDYGESPYIPLPGNIDDEKNYKAASDAGTAYIKSGKMAAFVVAGGQGSRLGYEGPKGKFPVGPVSGKPLFQIHGEKIYKYAEKYGVSIPWLIMTSKVNHEETVSYLEENGNFGLRKEDIHIFSQNMIPTIDLNGKLVLETGCTIFKNPDGHGGSLTALSTSGALDELKKRGINTVSYFQVDNPLAKIIDPVFIGFHVKKNADISSKGVKKAYPEEKMGVFVQFADGRTGIVEYSDLPKEKMFGKNADGEIKISMGSVAIHLFETDFIERATRGKEISLPFHRARKRIKVFADGEFMEMDGLKFEKFVFDALPLTEKNLVFETLREEEFAPVKNATGVDSVESAKELMSGLHKKWLEARGIKIPRDKAVIEISPTLAVEPGDLTGSLSIPDADRVYLK